MLPETILFPHGALPLHIFEPRYQQMLAEALESHCLICVATLLQPEIPRQDPSHYIHSVGTIGLIRTSREMKDGRSNLILHGMRRVQFQSWLSDTSYPKAHIRPIPSTPIPPEETLVRVSMLRNEVNTVLTKFPKETKRQLNDLLDTTTDQPEILVDVIAQQLVQDSELRLKLLSELSISNRFDLLTAYLKKSSLNS